MAGFSLTLSSEACDRLYDALSYLAKFSEFVTIEAQRDQLALSALNTSKSGYVHIVLSKSDFCSNYDYTPGKQNEQHLAYRILNKALQSVFKLKSHDPKRYSGVERCEISLLENYEAAESRLKIKFLCHGGIKKVFKLIYEAVEPLHALFDRRRATNSWKTKSRMLREFVEFFGTRTEQLDMCFENGRFVMTSYTEKIMDGKETLKQPLQTAISIETLDFEHFDVVDDLHVGINVKDFKNMVLHAESLQTTVTAMYSQPARPLQFSYSNFGLNCELTLMTICDGRGLETPSIQTRMATKDYAKGLRRQSEMSKMTEMPPPPQPASRAIPRPERRLGSRASVSQTTPNLEAESDSLFIPAEDDDIRWEPSRFQDDESDMLGWDATIDNDVSYHSTFHDGNSRERALNTKASSVQDEGIAPTQRASQLKGLFD